MGRLARNRDRRTGKSPERHEFYAEALRELPSETVWAVACEAEFRVDGPGDLRGVLHHDGAILRFTTWGLVERFVGSPMEFEWELVSPGVVHLVDRDRHTWFMNLTPLSEFTPEPPPCAAEAGSDLVADLLAWMRTWS